MTRLRCQALSQEEPESTHGIRILMALQREPRLANLMKTTCLPTAVLAIAFFLGNGARAALVVPSFVAYWRFDDGSGTIAADSSASGLAGTLDGFGSNTPNWIDGKFGGALEFDRSTADYVRVGGNNAVTQLAGEKTFSFWTRLPATTSGTNSFISIAKDNGNRWYIDDEEGNGRVRMWQAGGGVASGAQLLTDAGLFTYDNDTWHHVVVSDTGVGTDGTSVYVDGVLIDRYKSFDYSGLPSDSVLRLGCRYNYGLESMSGALDDFAILGTALTATHVNAVYSLGNTAGIQYDLGQVQGLFAAHNAGSDVRYGHLQWNYTTGIDTSGMDLGKVVKTGNRFVIALDDAGTGFVANTSLVAHWTFDEASGATAFDSAGVNDGTLRGSVGTATRIEGKLGTALSFNAGSLQWVEIGANNAVTALSGAKTLSFWTRLKTDGASNGFVAIDNGTSSNRWYIDDQNGAGHLRAWRVAGGTSGELIQIEDVFNYGSTEWQHVLIADDGTGLNGARVYVNGQFVGAGNSFDYSRLAAGSVLRLGAVRHGDGYRYLNGDLDDFGIWSVALTAPQALGLYEFGMEPGLGYDLGQVQQLFDLHEAGPGGGMVTLDGVWRWRYADGLDFDPGVLTKDGGRYFIQLDAAGAGLMAVPEPSAFALLACILGALLLRRR